jgi:hypothetical protein
MKFKNNLIYLYPLFFSISRLELIFMIHLDFKLCFINFIKLSLQFKMHLSYL